MELTDDQKKALKQWITNGATLSEVQKRLSDEFKVSLTYMDLRLTLIDLIDPIAQASPAPVNSR